jgi:hypothetical protein
MATRRDFCESLLAVTFGVGLEAAQMTSPAGTISVLGQRATFMVDFPRPLESVVYSFIQEYGWRITLGARHKSGDQAARRPSQ